MWVLLFGNARGGYMTQAKVEDTVLVVSDDPDMLLIATAVLGGKGYQVRVATDADSAVKILVLRQFPIVASVIDADLKYQDKIELECIWQGVNVHFMSGIVEDGVIRLRLPELGSNGEETAVAATILS